MSFSNLIKIIGIKYLLEKFNKDMKQIRTYLVIQLGKKPGDDVSRYLREIRKVMKIDFDIKSILFKENVLEIVSQIGNQDISLKGKENECKDSI